MSNFLTVYINHCEFFLMSFLESFVTCNALTISCVASVNIFSVRLRILFFFFLSSIIGKNVVTSQLVHLVFFNVFFFFLSRFFATKLFKLNLYFHLYFNFVPSLHTYNCIP